MPQNETSSQNKKNIKNSINNYSTIIGGVCGILFFACTYSVNTSFMLQAVSSASIAVACKFVSTAAVSSAFKFKESCEKSAIQHEKNTAVIHTNKIGQEVHMPRTNENHVARTDAPNHVIKKFEITTLHELAKSQGR